MSETGDGVDGNDATSGADRAGDATSGDGHTGDGESPRTGAPSRYDRVQRHPTRGPLNALQHWPEAVGPLRVVVNYLVVVCCRISPSLRLKNWLLRRLGVTVGEGVSWALESTPDVFFPELITVEDHAIIGYDATLLCHEFLQDEYRTGEIVVGERAMIGAGAIVLPGVHVGEGAQVAANSLVADDVPAGTTVAGVPAEPLGTVSDEE
ncbi:MAG: DapH/DapD/GlmU-related protein [Haloarculaceae archaeon]